MKRSIIQALFLIFVISFPAAGFGQKASAKKEFVMSVNRSDETQVYKFWELVYSEVFKRLGIRLKMVYFPMKRATYTASEGFADGEPARIYAYALSHPNLIRVEESVYSMTIAAFTANSSISEIKGWSSLKGTSYRIDYMRGMKISEDNLNKIVRKENLNTITTSIQGLKKLMAKRTDIYIDDDIVVASLIKKSFKNKIHVAGILETVPLYMYINRKNKDLLLGLNRVLKKMKSENLIKRYKTQVFGNSL